MVAATDVTDDLCGISLETTGDTAYCSICLVRFAATSSKAVKQHVKSKPHKAALKGVVAKKPSKERKIALEDVEDELWSLLGITGRFGTDAQYPNALHCSPAPDTPRPCRPPPLIPRPASQNLSQPFLTTQGASIPEVPSCLEHALHLLCNPGAARYPNIDVNNCNLPVKSWSHAAKLLTAAEQAQDSYWVSFVADIQHPQWWPRAGQVPTYNNVIAGRGSCSIGLHIDVDNFTGTRTPVCTYLCMLAGRKRVLLLPPGQTLIPLDTRDNFPHKPTPEEWAAIEAAGGYYFDLAPGEEDGCPVTLYMPAGWCHWLVGVTDWHVVLSGSFRPQGGGGL